MGLLEWALIWLVSLEDSDIAEMEGGHSNSTAVSKLRWEGSEGTKPANIWNPKDF